MTWAHWITRKDAQGPVWVAEIAGTTSRWFSSIPMTATLPSSATAAPIMDPVTLPSRDLSLTGGSSRVGSVTLKLRDIKSSYWKVTSVLFSRTLVGAPVNIYHGFTADTTWNTTNYPLLWSGRITDYQYAGGVWTVTCEDQLALAKGTSLPVNEFTADVKVATTAASGTLELQNVCGLMEVTAGTDLLDGDGDFEEDADLTPWSVVDVTDAGNNPTVTKSNTYAHGGTYSMKAVCTTASKSEDLRATYYNGGSYIAIPAAHKAGDTYCVTGWLRAVNPHSAPVAGRRVHIRPCLYGLTAGGTIQEYGTLPGGYSTAGPDTGGDTGWFSFSCCVTVFDPSTTMLKLVLEFGHANDENSCTFYFDDIYVRKVSRFLAAGKAVFGVVSYDKSTNTATVAQGAFGAMQGPVAVDEKAREVTPFMGYGGDIIARLLTTSSVGANGSWDYGDGMGAAIPYTLVDLTALAALSTSYPYHTWCILLDKPESDLLAFIDKEILAIWGASLTVSKTGLLTVKVTPSSVAAGTHALTDAKAAKPPTCKCTTGEMVNRVYVQTDFDFMDTIETNRDSDPATEAIYEPVTRGKLKRDPKYLGFYAFNEEDHRIDYVWKDQDLTSLATHGEKTISVSCKHVRGLPSVQLGLPHIKFNYGSEYLVQKGEEMARSLAERFVTYFNSPVYAVEYHALMWGLGVEPGDTVSITSDYLPNLDPATGGTVGVSGVLGYVQSVKPSTDGATLTCIVTGWASTIPTDQPTWDAVTAPSAANLATTSLNTATFTTGQHNQLPKTTIYAAQIDHKYGGVVYTRPTTNKWARTEVRMYMGQELGYTKVARADSISFLVASIAGTVALRSLSIYWLLKDGTYSAAYTVTI